MKMIFFHGLGTRETEADADLLLNDPTFGGPQQDLESRKKFYFAWILKGTLWKTKLFVQGGEIRDGGVTERSVPLLDPRLIMHSQLPLVNIRSHCLNQMLQLWYLGTPPNDVILAWLNQMGMEGFIPSSALPLGWQFRSQLDCGSLSLLSAVTLILEPPFFLCRFIFFSYQGLIYIV